MIAIAIAAMALLLHRAVEEMVCTGENAPTRRYWWSLGTSAALIVGMLVAWAVVFSTVQWRGEYGGITLALSPFIIVFALVHAYLARLAHDEVTLAMVEDAVEPTLATAHADNKVRQ